jgi:multiple sugar transport system permease protein
MDSKALMAIAGGVSPDVIYVNFRQSDTYIQQGFLYPLDKPEDQYFTSLTEEEKKFRIHSKVWPVMTREGPDGKTHVWAMPQGGIYGKVILYRKDLLDACDIPYPKNDWTWEDMLEICRKVTNPAEGTYGIRLGTGRQESWYWINFLWSAGGEAVIFDKTKKAWQSVFNTPEAVTALDFYTRLCTEPWVDETGRRRYGYAIKEATDGGQKWALGKIAFYPAYINEKMFQSINPDLTGMVPVPIGPGGHRGAELNSRMQGIFAGIKDAVIRDAAWEYLRFIDSKEAVGIRTRILVELGMGRFVNPLYLKMFGYEDLIRMAPKGWAECFKIAVDTGKPEPYGRNCQLVYDQMSPPITTAENMALAGTLAENKDERYAQLQTLLDESVREVNEKMIGIVPPQEILKRRIAAFVMLIMIVCAFTLLFRRISKVFAGPVAAGDKPAGWGFRKYFWGYLLLIPALGAIFFWQYLPLGMGSLLSFQDYRIMEGTGGSPWIGVDNFGAVLWDKAWWQSVWNSARYCFLVVSLTFLPPVILAVLLHEIPRGKILFRTIFYLPAVISGLVVIYLWQSFYEPSEYGVLNALVLAIPAIGYIILGALFFLILFFFAKRLMVHSKYITSLLCLLAGAALFMFFFNFARPILFQDETPWYLALFHKSTDPYRWLLDPKTAMFCCVLPMVWAGMGPGCLIYLAALKGIAEDFYEAADIDGASFIDKILFVVIPILKPLLIIQFIGIFIHSWQSEAFILAMTGGASNTEVAGLHIFYKAYMYLKFGPAAAMAWMLGFMLIGFTVHQLRILSRLEFKTTGNK